MRKLIRSVITEEIYEIIKEQIIGHRLKPGDKINIDLLSRELNVSNIPIRETLSRLMAEGFVTAVPFKGMFVTRMSVQELDDIFELRLTLELLALRKAIPSLDKKKVVEIREEWREADFPPDQLFEEALNAVMRMNEKMHGVYLECCGNEMLAQLVKQYIERIQRYLLVLHPNLRRELLQTELSEHLHILDALAEGEADRALFLLEQHLNNSHIRTREIFLQSEA